MRVTTCMPDYIVCEGDDDCPKDWKCFGSPGFDPAVCLPHGREWYDMRSHRSGEGSAQQETTEPRYKVADSRASAAIECRVIGYGKAVVDAWASGLVLRHISRGALVIVPASQHRRGDGAVGTGAWEPSPLKVCGAKPPHHPAMQTCSISVQGAMWVTTVAVMEELRPSPSVPVPCPGSRSRLGLR